MNEKQQIEEIADLIYDNTKFDTMWSEIDASAKAIYNAGYRKQSEGEWKADKSDIEWGDFLKKKHCSVCGSRPYFDKDKFKFILTKFCPNCGAKMKGE